jgi:hypothetical protein
MAILIMDSFCDTNAYLRNILYIKGIKFLTVVSILSHTTPHAIDSIKSWRQIYENLDYEIKNSLNDFENHLQDIAKSELQKIATRPWLMVYNDLINWDLEKVYIPTRSILNDQGAIIGSFRPEHIQVMYTLSPNPKFIYNAEFIVEF